METNIVVDLSPPIPCLAKLWFSSYGPKCCQPIKLQDSLKCNISKKKWMTKFIFSMQINIEVFYKLILSFCVFCVCSIRRAQSTQNKKFQYLCNISRKDWGGVNLIFCLQMNTEGFYKLIVSLWVCVASHSQSTQNKFTYLCNISRKTWKWTWYFAYKWTSKVSSNC